MHKTSHHPRVADIQMVIMTLIATILVHLPCDKYW